MTTDTDITVRPLTIKLESDGTAVIGYEPDGRERHHFSRVFLCETEEIAQELLPALQRAHAQNWPLREERFARERRSKEEAVQARRDAIRQRREQDALEHLERFNKATMIPVEELEVGDWIAMNRRSLGKRTYRVTDVRKPDEWAVSPTYRIKTYWHDRSPVPGDYLDAQYRKPGTKVLAVKAADAE